MNPRLRTSLTLVVISAVCGGLFGLTVDSPETFWLNGATGAGVGVMVSSQLMLFEYYLEPTYLERPFSTWPFAAVLGTRTGFYTAASLLALWLIPSIAAGQPIQILHDDLWRQLSFSIGFAFAVNLVIEFARLIGPRTLLNVITGRYYRPLTEERAVLFLDMVGSTRLAEAVGPARFHAVLNAVFVRLGAVISAHHGEIYRYVGDEIIATWPVRDATTVAQALSAATGCLAALEAEGPRFEREHGVRPRVRAGLHLGPLLTGEVGGFKKEIAFLGDVMNTAARLQEACRDLGKDLLVSRVVVDQAPVPPGWRIEPLGKRRLRGRAEPVDLAALTRL